MRGHWLTTTGGRLEEASIEDFLDLVYTYSINSPEIRHDMRSSILGYAFDFQEEAEEKEADKTFDGFKKQALNKSMIDQLDAFSLG